MAQGSSLALTLHEPFERLVVATRDSLPASPSSTPLSVVGAWDGIRAAFAAADQARTHGFTAKDFSLHVKGGRCEACEGAGRLRVSMDFLPDAWVHCETCKGRRYGAQALECLIDGRSIADVLEMSVADVRASFEENAAVAPALALLEEIGLGYLRAGQGADTLSGGERQRLALAADLRTRSTARSIYLFDEPTTGLHADDITRLLALFDRLIAEGHTLVVVEHNLQVIAAADHVIDLGPDAGSRGGRVVAEGTPDQIAAAPSWTGRALSRMS